MGTFKKYGIALGATLALCLAPVGSAFAATTHCTPATPGHSTVVHHAAVTHKVTVTIPGKAAVTKKVTVTIPGKAAVTAEYKLYKDFVKGTPPVGEPSAKLYRHVPGGGLNDLVWLGPDNTVVSSPNQAAYIPVSEIGSYSAPNGPAGGHWSASQYVQGPTPGTPDVTYYLHLTNNGTQSKSTNKADASWVKATVSVGAEWSVFDTKIVVITPGTPAKKVTKIVVITPAQPPVKKVTTVIDKPGYTTNKWVPGTSRHCTTVPGGTNHGTTGTHHGSSSSHHGPSSSAAAHAKAAAAAKAAHLKQVAAANAKAQATARANAAAAHARYEANLAAARAWQKSHHKTNYPVAKTGLSDDGSNGSSKGLELALLVGGLTGLAFMGRSVLVARKEDQN